MKAVKNKWVIVCTLLWGAVTFFSCVDDISPVGPSPNPDDRTNITVNVRVPGNSYPSSRALEPKHEQEVTEITVLAFARGDDTNWDTVLKQVGHSIGAPTGSDTEKQFRVELQSGVYDLMVLANSKEIIQGILGEEIPLEMEFTKSELQNLITLSVKGTGSNAGDAEYDKWNVNPDESKGYLIPMWGIRNNITITKESNQIIKSVNLYRMLAKVDVEIQRLPSSDPEEAEQWPGITEENFTMTHVSFHNYNRCGRIIPGVEDADGNWEAEEGGGGESTVSPVGH